MQSTASAASVPREHGVDLSNNGPLSPAPRPPPPPHQTSDGLVESRGRPEVGTESSADPRASPHRRQDALQHYRYARAVRALLGLCDRAAPSRLLPPQSTLIGLGVDVDVSDLLRDDGWPAAAQKQRRRVTRVESARRTGEEDGVRIVTPSLPVGASWCTGDGGGNMPAPAPSHRNADSNQEKDEEAVAEREDWLTMRRRSPCLDAPPPLPARRYVFTWTPRLHRAAANIADESIDGHDDDNDVDVAHSEPHADAASDAAPEPHEVNAVAHSSPTPFSTWGREVCWAGVGPGEIGVLRSASAVHSTSAVGSKHTDAPQQSDFTWCPARFI